VVLNYSEKTVNIRVAYALRMVADTLEGAGYHVRMIPLPNEVQFKALCKAGKDLKKYNIARIDAGMWAVASEFNIPVVDKTWKGLHDGSGVYFTLHWSNSLHINEFLPDELFDAIFEVASNQNKLVEVLHNKEYSVIYLYEPDKLPA
jgi:hypothetical protein